MDYSDIQLTNIRHHPEAYKLTQGDQGVFLYEPYRSELIPHLKLGSVQEAKTSSQKIYEMFFIYIENRDFPGADMAKKYLLMGFNCSARSLKDGAKKVTPTDASFKEATAADYFFRFYEEARKNKTYLALKEDHRRKYKK